MENILNRIFENSEGLLFKVLSYNKDKKYTVVFEGGVEVSNVGKTSITKGNVKNPYHPTIYGIGYIGTHRIKTPTKVRNKVYTIWVNMLRRCYKEEDRELSPTYEGVTVCAEWHNFENYFKWYESNYDFNTMENFHVDKDILYKNSKIYSPETCCFVPKDINCLFTEKKKVKNTDMPCGVVKHGRKFRVRVCLGDGEKYLESLDTLKEAEIKYKEVKEKHIRKMAEVWKPKLTQKVYEALINYRITD